MSDSHWPGSLPGSAHRPYIRQTGDRFCVPGEQGRASLSEAGWDSGREPGGAPAPEGAILTCKLNVQAAPLRIGR